MSVLSTSGASDGSDTAREIESLMRKCPHVRQSGGADALGEATDLVLAAERAVVTADHLLRASAHRDLMEDLLAKSNDDLDRAESLLDQALEEEYAADELEAKAERALAGSALTATAHEGLPGAGELVDAADDMATRAKALVADEASREARQLRSRVDQVRAQIGILRTQL